MKRKRKKRPALAPTASTEVRAAVYNKGLLLAALALFILAALALHWYSFAAPMYYDSVGQLESKEHIYASGLSQVVQLYPQRPVPIISFYFNYIIWGMNPFYFRIVNAVILAFTALIAALTFIFIFDAAVPANSASLKEKQVLGIFLGLVFLVHPIQTYFVAYIWQRVGLLCCFFYISSLAAYIATRSGRFRHPVAGYSLCLVLFCLALTSKEKAATLPVVLILAEIAFFWNGWKSLFRRLAVFAGVLVPLLVIFSFFVHPHGHEAETPGIFATVTKYYDFSHLSLSQVVISQCRVLFSYLGMILAPTPSNVRFSEAHVIFTSPFESPVIMASVLGALVMFAAGIFLLRKRPLTGFGLLFFLVNLVPEAISIPQYLFFAHRANLAMFGLLLVVGDFVLAILRWTRSLARKNWYLSAPAGVFLAAIIILAISAVTVSKARLWQDPVAFWTDVVQELPSYGRNVEKRIVVDALDALGLALQRQARAPEAIPVLRRAAEIDPLHALTYVSLGSAHAQLNEMSEAESALRIALEIDPRSTDAQFGLAQIYLAQRRFDDAWPHMQKAADLAPSDPKYVTGLGRILALQGKALEASEYFLKAIAVGPGYDQAYYNLGETYASVGRDQEAERQFNKALELKHSNWQTHNSLGLLLAKSGKSREAIAHFREALALNPGDWGVHNNLGAMLAKSGNLQEAAVHFETALRIHPGDISAVKNLERVRRLMGGQSVK